MIVTSMTFATKDEGANEEDAFTFSTKSILYNSKNSIPIMNNTLLMTNEKIRVKFETPLRVSTV